jgi:hypothetical protein
VSRKRKAFSRRLEDFFFKNNTSDLSRSSGTDTGFQLRCLAHAASKPDDCRGSID